MAVDKSISILIVDDYPTMRRIARNLLKQLGFTSVDDAANGNDALEKLRAKPYGLVISDSSMQPLTGLELLKQMRADDRLKDIPLILMTAETKSGSVLAAREAGVSNYIVKPFDADTLKAKIAAVLGDF